MTSNYSFTLFNHCFIHLQQLLLNNSKNYCTVTENKTEVAVLTSVVFFSFFSIVSGKNPNVYIDKEEMQQPYFCNHFFITDSFLW